MCRVILAALLLFGAGVACGRGAVHVVSVRASAGVHEAGLRSAGIDEEVLTGLAWDGLTEAGFKTGQGKRSYRAHLEVVSARRRLTSDGPVAEVAVDLELSPAGANPGAGALLETGLGTTPVLPGAFRAAFRGALWSAVRQASEGLAIALREESKPSEKLILDLRSDDPRVREQAIRILGDRRCGEAVPALVERLGDPEPLLAERAAGALAQIRDPRAVGPLIDYSRRRDDAEVARFARILGDVGGREARGYLQTLESGHPDQRVRAAAREALQDLDEREREQGRLSEKGGPSGPSGADSGRMGR